MRITCDRCGKDRMLNEAHTPQRDMKLSYIITKARHAGGGGGAGRAELLTGVSRAPAAGRCARPSCARVDAAIMFRRETTGSARRRTVPRRSPVSGR
jgi:hypothetical protein